MRGTKSVIVDSSHYRWAVGTAVATLLIGVSYAAYSHSLEGPPTGGTPVGLLYGIIGSLLMLYAGLFSAKKKLPRLRLGSARGWLKAHLWLGLLSVPFIFAHSAGRFGGLLERILMAVFLLIILSGMVGVALQQWLPRYLRTNVPAPGMYQQLPEIFGRLLATADTLVLNHCGSLFEGFPGPPSGDWSGGVDAKGPSDDDLGAGGRSSRGVPRPPAVPKSHEQLKRFYLELVRPFLIADGDVDPAMNSAATADVKFSMAGEALAMTAATASEAKPLLDALAQLADICAERRQLMRQAKLFRLLHGWLFVHIPLSCALLVFGLAHIISALYY